MNLQKNIFLFLTISFLQSTAYCAAVAAGYQDSDYALSTFESMMVKAIIKKDTLTIENLLDLGFNPNKKTHPHGITPLLMLAIAHCKPEQFAQALANNPTKSISEIRENFIAPITLLLDAGANPNDNMYKIIFPLMTTWNLTPAQKTEEFENVKLSIIKSLLNKGANPKAFKIYGKTKKIENKKHYPLSQLFSFIPKALNSDFYVTINENFDIRQRFFIASNFTHSTADQDIAKYIIRHGANPEKSFYGEIIKKEFQQENESHCAFQELAEYCNPRVPPNVTACIFAMLHGSLNKNCYTQCYASKPSTVGCTIQ